MSWLDLAYHISLEIHVLNWNRHIICHYIWPPWLGWPLWNICVTNDHWYVPLVVDTSRSLPHSWLITVCIWLNTRVPLVEQELSTLSEHLSSSPGFSWVQITRSLVCFMCMFCRSLFALFLLPIVLSVHLRFTDSHYSFGIFKLFLYGLIYFIVMWHDATM